MFEERIYKDINCTMCGILIQNNRCSKRKYCTDCAKIQRKVWDKEAKIKKRKQKECLMCKALFYPMGPQKYCKICIPIITKQRQVEYNKKKYFKLYYCKSCGNKFKPNGRRQIYCKNCIINIDKNRVHEWYIKNKNRALLSSYKSKEKQKKENPLYLIYTSSSGVIRSALKRLLKLKKDRKTVEYLGCSISFLKKHLESQWDHTMSWDNYGKYPEGWDMDHIKPVSSAKTLEELIPLLHYTNLQPLNSKINRELKKDKIDFKI